jgi:hypothetical protein
VGTEDGEAIRRQPESTEKHGKLSSHEAGLTHSHLHPREEDAALVPHYQWEKLGFCDSSAGPAFQPRADGDTIIKH